MSRQICVGPVIPISPHVHAYALSIYLFECEKCGYRTTVVGGLAEGYEFKVQSIHCRDCRSIHDCVIACKTAAEPWWRGAMRRATPEPAPKLEQLLTKLPAPPRPPLRWKNFDPTCPRDPTHRIEYWNNPGRCPRCRAYLDRAAVPFRIWE